RGLRKFEADRTADQSENDKRQSDHQQQGYDQNRRPLPGSLLPLAGPNVKGNRTDESGKQRQLEEPQATLEHRQRQKKTAAVENDAAGYDDALANVGQRLEHGVVPEQQLQQQRQIADDLHVAAGCLREQPVPRQTRDADNEADDRRKYDTKACDQKRVEQPDP